jgi:hypothetical protein
MLTFICQLSSSSLPFISFSEPKASNIEKSHQFNTVSVSPTYSVIRERKNAEPIFTGSAKINSTPNYFYLDVSQYSFATISQNSPLEINSSPFWLLHCALLI